MMLIELTLKPVQNVIDVGKPRVFKRTTGIEGTVSAATNYYHRPVHARGLLYLRSKMRIDLPVRAVIPRNHHRTDRMTNEKKFHFATAIDEKRVRISLQVFIGLTGLKMLHWKQSDIEEFVV